MDDALPRNCGPMEDCSNDIGRSIHTITNTILSRSISLNRMLKSLNNQSNEELKRRNWICVLLFYLRHYGKKRFDI